MIIFIDGKLTETAMNFVYPKGFPILFSKQTLVLEPQKWDEHSLGSRLSWWQSRADHSPSLESLNECSEEKKFSVSSWATKLGLPEDRIPATKRSVRESDHAQRT